ncbi:hypothetical protein A6R71_01215 [Xanthomonas translucens pv. arrhenatheri]|nr:hypothetical protein A6R71_01215 [Xanthomonas translucens pv. arrhenatheri]
MRPAASACWRHSLRRHAPFDSDAVTRSHDPARQLCGSMRMCRAQHGFDAADGTLLAHAPRATLAPGDGRRSARQRACLR